MGTLEQVGISVAFQEEASRKSAVQLQAMRTDFDSFVLTHGQRLAAIEATLQTIGQRMDAIGAREKQG